MTERDLSGLLRMLGGMDDDEAEQFLERAREEFNKPAPAPKAGGSIDQQALVQEYNQAVEAARWKGKEAVLSVRRDFRARGLESLGGDPGAAERRAQAAVQPVLVPLSESEIEELRSQYHEELGGVVASGCAWLTEN